VFLIVCAECVRGGLLGRVVAKALYRQGLARVTLKEDEEAEKVLVEALSIAKDDKAISGELERLRQRKKAARDKEKAVYKKMFE
jgi:peptidyl-prolyl isomerase D